MIIAQIPVDIKEPKGNVDGPKRKLTEPLPTS